MSYDVYLVIDTGGKDKATVADIGNYTSNVGGMYLEAFSEPFQSLQNMPCDQAIPLLNRAIQRMEAEPEKYREMNPPNGWGNYEGALDYLRSIRDECTKHPKAEIYISY